MKQTIIQPCEALKDIISHFWTGTWDVKSQGPVTTYYTIANSQTDIVFAFDSAERYSELLFSAVQGHTHIPVRLPVTGFYHLIGVSLHSYAVPMVFRMPASELSDVFTPLHTLLGSDGTVLNEKMALAASTEERIRILTDYLQSRMKGKQPEDPLIAGVIEEIRQSGGERQIRELAEYACLSQKQFKRRFKQFSGFNPKMYTRIVRFESIVKGHSDVSHLTRLAHAKGYHDQAHFNHDFREFTGFSPRDFWKLSEDAG